MLLCEIDSIPQSIKKILAEQGITTLRPSQEKAINAGLLEGKNLLICTPTASGKTLIAEIAAARAIITLQKQALYIVPLVALANDKHQDFTQKYMSTFSVAVSTGDLDSPEQHLAAKHLIICTAEKLDSIMRHQPSWIKNVGVVIIDEIHLLNDTDRGPTLEILITWIRKLLPNVQIIGLSATIGNPQELADWLDATLVQDTWRPVPLHTGILHNHIIDFGK